MRVCYEDYDAQQRFIDVDFPVYVKMDFAFDETTYHNYVSYIKLDYVEGVYTRTHISIYNRDEYEWRKASISIFKSEKPTIGITRYLESRAPEEPSTELEFKNAYKLVKDIITEIESNL